MTLIDKIAWMRLADGKILSTRSRGMDVCPLPGAGGRVSPVDQLIVDHLQRRGEPR